MLAQKFFEEQSDQSEVKARIVQKYFDAWSNVIVAAQARYGGDKIVYIDLYAGPGRYRDGSASTPLLILEKAIANPKIGPKLVAIFNDGDRNNTDTLRNEIATLPGVETLKKPPTVLNAVVGDELEKSLSGIRLAPTFSFIDPFGYKGLSLRIVNAVIKDWGCDCVFFFNYNRINMGLGNERVAHHMDALFGQERADKLRKALAEMEPGERDAFILNELSSALKEMGGRYVLPFRFKREEGERTSHYLVFVSKNIRGYEIMKDIMAGESSTADQGMPSFTYAPADAKYPLLFSLSRPLDGLADDLLKRFSGRTLTMGQVHAEHHVDTPFVSRNYKAALRRLEAEGRITADPPAKDRRKVKGGEVSFREHVKVTFP